MTNNLLSITIESLGGLGDGIASVSGKPLFVSKSCVGDKLKIRITEDKEETMRGEIEEILAPGPDRVDHACSHYATCGGCSLMHLSPASYRNFKQRNFDTALRLAGFEGTKSEIVFLDAATRRRAEFKLAPLPQGGVALAYYQPRSHTPVVIERCHILEPSIQALVKPAGLALSALPSVRHIKSVSLTAADGGMDMVLTYTVWDNDFATALRAMAKSLKLSRISVRLPNNKIEIISDRSLIFMQLGPYQIPMPPDAFLQATAEGQRILTQTIIEALPKEGTVADLFSGIGTYSFAICDKRPVHAVESDRAMVMGMQSTIKRQGMESKVTAEQRDLFKNPLTAKELNRFSAVILNPPRIGAKKQSEELAQSTVSAVIMVSCNPASFTRDAKALKAGGFTLTHATGIDQFVFSPHFEIVSVFKR